MQVMGLLKKNAEDRLSTLTANVSLSSSMTAASRASVSSTGKMTPQELEKVLRHIVSWTIACYKSKKANSLDRAPLTILNSGTFTTSEVAADWQ